MKHIINRRKFLELFGCSCCGLLVSSCSTVPITERRQLITSGNDLKQIEEIGQRIQYSVSTFFTKRNQVDPTKNFEWEYVLVDNDKVKNAWCMPGGKIAVYTGMLKITENKHGLAVVMGHEIAHAVAKHSIERQSQATTVNVGTQILDVFIKVRFLRQLLLTLSALSYFRGLTLTLLDCDLIHEITQHRDFF